MIDMDRNRRVRNNSLFSRLKILFLKTFSRRPWLVYVCLFFVFFIFLFWSRSGKKEDGFASTGYDQKFELPRKVAGVRNDLGNQVDFGKVEEESNALLKEDSKDSSTEQQVVKPIIAKDGKNSTGKLAKVTEKSSFKAGKTDMKTKLEEKIIKVATDDKILKENLNAKKTIVLIMTYFRSGSSLMGEALSSNGNAIYFAEPAHYVTSLSLKDKNAVNQYKIDLLADILSCRNESDNWKAFFASKNETESVRLHSKLRFMGQLSARNISELTALMCKSSQYIVAKVPRFGLELVDGFVEKVGANASVKIIHLFRDPRAVLNSLRHLNASVPLEGKPNKTSEEDFLCRDLYEKNLNISEPMQNSSKFHYRRVFYENVIREPVKQLTSLFQFMGYDKLSSKGQAFIDQHLLNRGAKNVNFVKPKPNSNEDNFGTFKTNPKEEIDKWRKQISQSDLEKLNKACGNVLNRLGYKI